MSPYTFSSTLHCTDGHIAGLASKLFFAEEFEESPLASVVSLYYLNIYIYFLKRKFTENVL